MNLLVHHLLVFLLISPVLGSKADSQLAFSEALELLAGKLGLLSEDPQKNEASMPQNPVEMPGNLNWNWDRIIPKGFEPVTKSFRYAQSVMENDPALPEVLISGRTLVMPQAVVGIQKFHALSVILNSHILRLEGGIFELNGNIAAFMYDWTTDTAIELKPDDQMEQLKVSKKSLHQILNQAGECYRELLLLKSLETEEQSLKRKSLIEQKKALQQQQDEIDLEWYNDEEQEEQHIQPSERLTEEIEELRKAIKAASPVFKTLLYHDLGRIEEATEIPHIPLRSDDISIEDILLPEDEQPDYKITCASESIILIRVLQMIKYFKALRGEELFFENIDLQALNKAIDGLAQEMAREEREKSIKAILLTGANFIASSKPYSCYDALIAAGDNQVKDLFLKLYPEANLVFKHSSLSLFAGRNFDVSAWDQILPYSANSHSIPLTVKLTIDHDRDAFLTLFAFISKSGILYIFRNLGDYVSARAYGPEGVAKTLIFDILFDKEDGPKLMFQGHGIAFYGNFAFRFKRVKGILPNV